MKSIPIQELLPYLPHRPPMVWVDEVTKFSSTDGECLVMIKADALYMSSNGLRASSCLEFIAQAFGFVWSCYLTRTLDPASGPMKRAMLVSFKDAHFARPEVLSQVVPGDVLRVPIEGVRAVGSITAFLGKVFKGEELLCEVQMRTFCE